MNYAEYGLDTVKKEKDDDVKVGHWHCLWCNQDKSERAFSLCFSNFVICSSCINEALHYKDQQSRWQRRKNVDCWKCKKTPVRGYRNHESYGMDIWLCKDCITLGRKLIDGFEEQKKLKQTHFETMVQDIINRCTIEGNIVKLPEGQLDRDIYQAVKKKLEGIGGKWKGGKTNGFVFDHDPAELLAQLQAGENINLKKDYQFFPTPPDIAKQMASYLPPSLKDGYKILEPSAGKGDLVIAVQEHFGFDCEVDCYELMDQNVTKLKTIPGVNVKGNDFMLADCKTKYDIIIANPPFTKNQDIDHIRLMYDLLKPGGMLVTLCSPSFTFTSVKKQEEFKAWLEMLDVFPLRLEEKCFASSGTNITPVLLQFVKPALNGIETFTQLEPATKEPDFVIASDEKSERRSCRVCGCTDENCIQCIQKTGQPCHWVEKDLCSACVEIPQKISEEVPLTDSTTSISPDENFQDSPKEETGSTDPIQPLHPDSTAPIEEEIHAGSIEAAGGEVIEDTDEPSPITTNFFSELKASMHQLAPDVTLRVQWTGEAMRVVVIPNNGVPADSAPLVLDGTEEEMNTEFFGYMSAAVLKASRSVTDVEGYNKKIADARKEVENLTAGEEKTIATVAAKPAAPVKNSEVKKPAPKKEKSVTPSLFS